MLRVRFKANPDDYRPVNWPVKHPFWCTGQGGFTALDQPSYSIVISYADNLDYILKNWPEAKDLEIEERAEYTFTDRFPKPEWFGFHTEID